MSWRGETEDGIGWGGLVPTKAERAAERVEATQRGKMLAMETALLRIAAFPRTRDEELSIEGAREIARAALAYCKPANVHSTPQPSVHDKPTVDRLQMLARRSLAQLRKWAEWYGNADHAAHGQLPLPPAGDVELAEDIIEALAPNAELTSRRSG